MEIPILYALTHPGRVPDAELRTFDPVRCPPLTFEAPDHARFPLLGLGYEAGRRGGAAPIAFNAANEVAVSAFLAEELSFPEMMNVVVETVERSPAHPIRELGDAIEADRAARERALDLVRDRGSAGPTKPMSKETLRRK
jgi:1-deoxy-D-xylulose-5-phosphate reductoisomerase